MSRRIPRTAPSLSTRSAPGASPVSELKVGDLARRTGKSIRALRHYEDMGLLSPARSTGNFRLYGPDQVARVYWISKLQDMGFTLAQIQCLITTVESSATGPGAMTSLRELFRARLSDTRLQVERLLQLERDLGESLAYLEGCRACSDDHELQACASCDSVHADDEAPSLVAGVHLHPSSSAPVKLRIRQPSLS